MPCFKSHQTEASPSSLETHTQGLGEALLQPLG